MRISSPQKTYFNNAKSQISSYSLKNSTQIAFGSRYQKNLKIAQEILNWLANKKIYRPTYIEMFGSGLRKKATEVERVQFQTQHSIYSKKLEAIREYISNKPFASPQERTKYLENLVFQHKVANCGELAEIATEHLSQKGLNAFHGVFSSCMSLDNHGVAIVTDAPITHECIPIKSLMKMKNVIIVDSWLNKIFTNVRAAIKTYSKLFGITTDSSIVNSTSLARKRFPVSARVNTQGQNVWGLKLSERLEDIQVYSKEMQEWFNRVTKK